MPEPPQTEEGWFVHCDFRVIDWDAWRDAPDAKRERALEDGQEFLEAQIALENSEAGQSALFTITGDEADILILGLRPELDTLERAERRFETTAFAEFTEQVSSYLAVTEVSGYSSPEYFDDPESVDTGVKRYMDEKLTPEIPEDTYVSFYPLNRRRQPEANWYDLAFEERAELLAGHAEIGREYAGEIQQVIASSVGLDDWEWGVTLFADDPTLFKEIVYEMRFDEASSKYADFGSFYVGRRFPPSDLPAFMAGDPVPADAENGDSAGHGESEAHHDTESPERSPASSEHSGGPPRGVTTDSEHADLRETLSDLDVYAGQPHGEDVYALVLYSEAEGSAFFEEVSGLRSNFDHYETHVKTAVYETAVGADLQAVVSIWDTQSAADTAAGFLSDLPGIVAHAGAEDAPAVLAGGGSDADAEVSEGDGWGTMGMFYSVKPDYQQEFVETFDEVGELLGEMDGHLETVLLANREDENDMFIASQWASKDDAMEFFRSDAFRDTVEWGREVLDDRPRHVFLA